MTKRDPKVMKKDWDSQFGRKTFTFYLAETHYTPSSAYCPGGNNKGRSQKTLPEAPDPEIEFVTSVISGQVKPLDQFSISPSLGTT